MPVLIVSYGPWLSRALAREMALFIGQTSMRFLDRVKRRGDGAWRVLRRGAIYDDDWMVPAVPGVGPALPDACDAPGRRFLA